MAYSGINSGMAKGKRGPIPETDNVLPAPQPAETAAPDTSARDTDRVRTSQRRIAIPVTDAGKISWENMRQSTREETEKFIRGMLNDRELAARMGIEKPLVEIFPPEWTSALYDALGQMEAALAPKLLGVSPQIAQEFFTYSPIEKEKLARPTSAVINKYAADWLIRFKEEIALLMLLGSITYAKIMAAKMAQEIMNRRSPEPHAADEEKEPVQVPN